MRDALAVRAFELFCVRSGMHVMALPVSAVAGLSEVVASLSPDAVVIAGSDLPDHAVALWVYRVRATAGTLLMALFRRAHHRGQMRTTGSRILPETPQTRTADCSP